MQEAAGLQKGKARNRFGATPTGAGPAPATIKTQDMKPSDFR